MYLENKFSFSGVGGRGFGRYRRMGKEGRNLWSYILIIEVLKVKKK